MKALQIIGGLVLPLVAAFLFVFWETSAAFTMATTVAVVGVALITTYKNNTQSLR